MKNKYLLWMPCALLGLGIADAAPQPYYITSIQVFELGTLGGNSSAALDINDAGEIVGWSMTVNGVKHAFLYRQGVMEDVTFGTFTQAEAHGINNRTQVVGIIGAPEGEMIHGFYYDNGSFFLLDESDPYTCITGGRPHAINDAGLIAGEHLYGCGPGGFSAKPAQWNSYLSPWKVLVHDFTEAVDYSAVHNVNSIGIIVGADGQTKYCDTGGWYWQSGSLLDVPKPAGLPSGWYSVEHAAFGINSYGRIVGQMSTFPLGTLPQPGAGVKRAYFWDGLTSNSEPLAIFNDGQNAGAREIDDEDFIAGWADRWIAPANAFEKRAAVWNQGKLTMLPLPPGIGDIFARVPTQCEANAVNNLSSAGMVQVVGNCQYAGNQIAMLWKIKTAQISEQPASPALPPPNGR